MVKPGLKGKMKFLQYPPKAYKGMEADPLHPAFRRKPDRWAGARVMQQATYRLTSRVREKIANERRQQKPRM